MRLLNTSRYILSNDIWKAGRRTCTMATRSELNTLVSRDAFVEKFTLKTRNNGPLSDLNFGVKDLFDVSGRTTGFGNPSWKTTHGIAEKTAPCVQMTLDAGATMIGTTHMDELAYSLNGENVHYGTPLNPAAPERVPGGSSSGSASCVASGDADFALGSDTAGSVRVPASYCGILGIRTTHGRLSLEGARPLAPGFDTVGWFAVDPVIFHRVGRSLLKSESDENSDQKAFRELVICKDAFSLTNEEASCSLLETAQKLGKNFPEGAQEVSIAKDVCGGTLNAWFQIFATLQRRQVWNCHGKWVSETKPVFGPGIKERFEGASLVKDEEVDDAKLQMAVIRKHVDALLGDDRVLCLPSAPGPAPRLQTPPEELEMFRSRALSLTCVSGLGGYPQVSLPLCTISGAPVGIGLVGPRGSDEKLLGLSVEIMKALG
ncbi:hypothetical protein BSKO_12073 [Bryopsis sp. KO-2023]|nr:hypothetical protein BSKO_12073 [Bryopsis sp. KO-2023]